MSVKILEKKTLSENWYKLYKFTYSITNKHGKEVSISKLRYITSSNER